MLKFVIILVTPIESYSTGANDSSNFLMKCNRFCKTYASLTYNQKAYVLLVSILIRKANENRLNCLPYHTDFFSHINRHVVHCLYQQRADIIVWFDTGLYKNTQTFLRFLYVSISRAKSASQLHFLYEQVKEVVNGFVSNEPLYDYLKNVNKVDTDSPTLCSSDILETIMSTLLPNDMKCPVYKMDIGKYFGREDKEKHYLDNFYAKEAISIDFNPMTSTRNINTIKNCFDNAVDNTWEYLTHKSAGYKYIYKDWEYTSLNDLYQNTVYGIKYEKYKSFESAFYKGKIVDVSKVPVSYLDDVESNNKAKEVSLLRKAPRQPKGFRSESREQKLSGCPKAKPSLPAFQDSMWRDESVDAFDYLRALIEEENKNKVVTPVEVYKCKRA